jgi:CRP-like cAMP-binding protein
MMAYKMGKIIVEPTSPAPIGPPSGMAPVRTKSRAASMKKGKTSFDPKTFLAHVGDGRSLAKYRKGQIVFSQGEIGDAVFYVQKGKMKVTVVSEQGKEAVVAILGAN